MVTYRVVLTDGKEFEVEAQGTTEEDGAVRFWEAQGYGRKTVASFAKGEWIRYYQPAKAKDVSTAEGPLVG